MDRTGTRIAAGILFAALAIRIIFVLATPNYALVADALDYQRHAVSIADGHGFALSYGRPTAFRPPAYPIFLAAVYVVTGPDVEWGRIANAFVGVGIVALIGLIAFQLWGRREALVALGLSAIYIPFILVGQSIMSEPLFVLCLLGAIAAVLHSKRWPWVIAAGVLMGLAILGRANAIILLLPLAVAVWRGWRAPLVLCVAAALTVAPWTIRNYETFHAFVPVSTQFGSALAGTYNSEAKADKQNPASWRTLKRVDDYRPIFNKIRSTPEPVLEKQLRKASHRVHQGAPRVRGDGRLLDDAPDARSGRPGLVDPHRGDDLGDSRVGDRGGDLLLDLRPAGSGGGVHAAGAGGAAVVVGGAAVDVPGRRVPGRGDAALPDGDRPVHRAAGRVDREPRGAIPETAVARASSARTV